MGNSAPGECRSRGWTGLLVRLRHPVWPTSERPREPRRRPPPHLPRTIPPAPYQAIADRLRDEPGTGGCGQGPIPPCDPSRSSSD